MSGKHYDKDSPSKKKLSVEQALDYPGVALDRADGEKTTPEMVKQSTKELNNNPRNNAGPEN